MTQYQNPIQYDGPPCRLVKLSAKDSQTWQAGHPLRTTDSGVVKCKTQASSISGFAAQTQGTATSSSAVWVNMIPSSAARFIIGVTAGSTDTKAGLTLIGKSLGMSINSCVATLNTSNDSDEIMKVHDVMGRVDPKGNDTSDVPGYAVVSFYQSALDADA